MTREKKQWVFLRLLSSIFIVAAIAIGCGGSKKSADATEAPKQWTEVYTYKGSGMKKSAPFQLMGGSVRAKYKFKAGRYSLFSFYVVPEGQDIMKTGGFPDVMIQQSEESETSIQQPAGSYYLNVNSSGGKWEIVVEEKK
ncbi:MAG: hypothetical protein ABUK01_03345 [Leptospirales bacterium]